MFGKLDQDLIGLSRLEFLLFGLTSIHLPLFYLTTKRLIKADNEGPSIGNVLVKIPDVPRVGYTQDGS